MSYEYPIYLNTNPKVLRNGGRKASKSTSLDKMLSKAWKAYLDEEGYDVEEYGEWDSMNPPEDVYNFIYSYLMESLQADLKINFDAENNNCGNDCFGPQEILGYHRLDNGLEYFGIVAGGDWEMFVFFIIYTDGKKLRAYVPTYGNTFNADTKTAIGSESECEYLDKVLEKYKKQFPEIAAEYKSFDYPYGGEFASQCFVSQFTDDMDNWVARLAIDPKKVIEDVRHRIEVV